MKNKDKLVCKYCGLPQDRRRKHHYCSHFGGELVGEFKGIPVIAKDCVPDGVMYLINDEFKLKSYEKS